MESVRVLTIADLLQRGRCLTGTSSFGTPSFAPKSNPSISPIPSNPNPNATTKVLPSLERFALIIGTVTLPSATSASASNAAAPRCSYNTCFQFSDNSAASICCDVLDFDARILDKRINVLAWNFIPFKRGGGFLEIIRWGFQDSIAGIWPCSNIISMELGSSTANANEDSSKARHGVFGALESVSPFSIVSCRTGDSNSKSYKALDSGPPTSLRGFLVQFMVCECRSCSSKESIMVLKDSIQERDTHSFTKPMFVYCCGSASSWHPVFTKLVGNIVAISGLKKKLVFIGKEESKVMCVTTGSSALHLSRLSKKWTPKVTVGRKGNGEVGTYRGIVKGVYMQGMVVELDNEVWLLLTDQLLTPPHSLRAGALVSVRNAHFVNPRFSWTRRMLILGACFRTNVIVESFSPIETRCHIASQSQSSLGKFIESLAFSSRLWVLLVASYFRKKFAGILSEKEILGSKHKGGLVEMYASSQMPSSKHQTRAGVFMEFCKHDSCACGCEPYIDNLTLVIPLSFFISHCEPAWMRARDPEGNSRKLHDDKQYSRQLCEGRSYVQSIRKIFSSEDIGITLIGSLKTSPSSGRLQLVDATGSIDVLVPDIPSTWDATRTIKVVDYSVIIEGVPGSVDSEGLLEYDLFSTRTIFDFVPLARKVNLTVCVYFRLRSPLCRNLCFYPCTGLGEDLKRFESGTFHLLWITHKFPVLHKFQGDVLTSSLSMFVEAIILPWNLSVAENNGIACQTGVVGDDPKNSMEFCAVGCYLKNDSFKRRKVCDSSRKELSSGSMDCSYEAVGKLNSCSESYIESSEDKTYSDLSCHEISGLAIISEVTRSVMLYCTKAKLNSDGFCGPSGQKILLEFKSDSFYKYQLLQIGCYYITKHDREDSFCNLKGSDYFIGKKILIPPTTHLWSLSFGSDEICQNNSSSKCIPLDDSLISDKLLSGYHNEVLQTSNENLSGTSSDMCLCLSASVLGLGELQLKELKESLIKPVVTPKDIPKISSCIRPVTTAPPLSTESNRMFPEGNLISMRGHVVAVHSVEDNSVDPYLNSQNLRDPLELRFLQRTTSSCIHVLVNNQIVKLSGSLCNHDFPVGFGPGVDATFYRILALWEQNRWILTSVSFITIHSISGDNESCGVKCSNPASYTPNASPQEIVRSRLISELDQSLDFKPMLLHCRVVAIHFLVLEKKSGNVNYQLKNHLRQHLVDVPLAGFVLDDGSSPCCCWANAERAATLLRLHEEFPELAFENSGRTLKWVRTDNNSWSSTIYHLERILNNHHRIVVRNYGSMFDSSYQDLAVSVSSDNALSSYDENLLKFIVFNACFSKFWTIGASMMDLDAVRRLKRENLVEMEMFMHSMQHIWAAEVQHINHLGQARNVIQELIDG
ncbi:putative CST complex subunit CTC1, plant protein [Rosa chinensis]|uniref:CST complex subunit CTC1 n=1 Tax=Rosa chinensis TaxID=74649 RepID=A0A2P6PDV9_ROSCH|nr:CST complex subunit CTC1 isoform X2 [Rosa chinensis]PRQ20115.1 putative CST complex subunit CTC1, plant protein [Rosa chinensis]